MQQGSPNGEPQQPSPPQQPQPAPVQTVAPVAQQPQLPQTPQITAPQPQQPLYQPAQQPTYAAPEESLVSAEQLGDELPESISWEASEYIHNDKGALWMIILAVIVLIGLGLAVWASAWTFAVLIAVMGAAMGFFAYRRPRVLRYMLSNEGIQIEDKLYHFSDFKSFGVLQDGAFFTMTFIPVKRFAPALNVYFAQDDGEDIVDIVGNHLPMEHIEPDLIDVLMRRLHF